MFPLALQAEAEAPRAPREREQPEAARLVLAAVVVVVVVTAVAALAPTDPALVVQEAIIFQALEGGLLELSIPMEAAVQMVVVAAALEEELIKLVVQEAPELNGMPPMVRAAAAAAPKI